MLLVLSDVKHTDGHFTLCKERTIPLSVTLTLLTELSFKTGRQSILLSQRKPLCRSADTWDVLNTYTSDKESFCCLWCLVSIYRWREVLWVPVTSCASSDVTLSATVACDDLASRARDVQSCCCLKLVDKSRKVSFSLKWDYTNFVSEFCAIFLASLGLMFHVFGRVENQAHICTHWNTHTQFINWHVYSK